MAGVALLLLLPLLLFTVAMVGVFASLIRWSFRIGVAVAAALVAAAVLPPGPRLDWVPVGVFVAMLVLLGRRAAPPRLRPVRVLADVPRRTAEVPPAPAWPQLRRLADWGTRRRIDAARDACERYLLLAETEEDPSAQLPIKLRRHLPTMIDDCVRHCRTATPDEGRALIADLLSALEPLAARAESRRRELAHAAQGRFRLLRTHLTTPET